MNSSAPYNNCKKRLEKLAREKYEKASDEVVEAVFDYYREKLGKTPDEDGILAIEVGYDGTWMTRGHSSLIGVGAVIEMHTGIVLDGYVCSKTCKSCTYWQEKVKDKNVVKYNNWKAKHECLKNFSESSGRMEAHSAVVLWSRSESKRLRYTVFVGDGDSSAYSAICALNNGNGPYGQEFPVVKEECINHVSKRLGTRLRTLKKKKD